MVGLHRLLARLEAIRKAHAFVAIAGMEGALPSVLAGLVDRPVIAVPTSVAYGVGHAGFGAADAAGLINRGAADAGAGRDATGDG